MSALFLYADSEPQRPVSVARQTEEIARELSRDGVRYERWTCNTGLPVTASQEQILTAYSVQIEALKAERGYRSVDVVRLSPDPGDKGWAEKARAARSKFLDEHVHHEDEVRFFVEGSGLFALHIDGHVRLVLCEEGDLLSVPAGTRHWFDMGSAPHFCAIRLFGSPDGWVASFTGDPIARHFPGYDEIVGQCR